MTITTIEEVAQTVVMMALMKDDLPDGQWDEVEEMLEDFGCRNEMTGKISTALIRNLSLDAQGQLITELNRNLAYWI